MLLPAPLWPIMPNVSPCSTSKLDVPQRPELLGLLDRARGGAATGAAMIDSLSEAVSLLLSSPSR